MPQSEAVRDARRDQTPAFERDQQIVLDPTESRQASPNKMNFRVLIGSLVLAVIIGAALISAFWSSTPNNASVTTPTATEQAQPVEPFAAPAAESTQQAPPTAAGSAPEPKTAP